MFFDCSYYHIILFFFFFFLIIKIKSVYVAYVLVMILSYHRVGIIYLSYHVLVAIESCQKKKKKKRERTHINIMHLMQRDDTLT